MRWNNAWGTFSSGFATGVKGSVVADVWEEATRPEPGSPEEFLMLHNLYKNGKQFYDISQAPYARVGMGFGLLNDVLPTENILRSYENIGSMDATQRAGDAALDKATEGSVWYMKGMAEVGEKYMEWSGKTSQDVMTDWLMKDRYSEDSHMSDWNNGASDWISKWLFRK